MKGRWCLAASAVLALSCAEAVSPGPDVPIPDVPPPDFGGYLQLEPDPVDFGEVLACSAGAPGYKDLDVTLQNTGQNPVTIVQVRLDPEGSADFTLPAIIGPNGSATTPLAAALNDRVGLVLRYEPRGGGQDTTRLIVDGDVGGLAAHWFFDVRGAERAPKLVAFPGQIDFGWVGFGETAEQPLVLRNEGNADLVLKAGGVRPTQGSDPGIQVLDGPATDLTLAPQAETTIRVAWTPTDGGLLGGSPIGAVVIESSDCASPTGLDVYGMPDAPCVEVLPTPVDFGFGAQNVPVQRVVTISNPCHGALGVTGMEIKSPSNPELDPEFAIVPDPTFPPTTGIEGEVAGFESRGVTVTFTNRGATTGNASAVLVLHTSQKGMETIEVPLAAQRTGSPKCDLRTVPMIVSFGVQAIGSTVEKPLSLVNAGTGYCTVQGMKITDCTADMMGAPSCQAPFTGAASTVFQLKDAPPVGTRVDPGQTWPMKVLFTPPSTTSIFGSLATSAAILGIRFKDDASGTVSTTPTGTTVGGTTTYKANLTGQGGTAKALVQPVEARLGVSTIGCFSASAAVCLMNSGNAPLQLLEATLDGCTPEFHLKDVPALPKSIPAGVPLCLHVNHSPQDPGQDRCRLVLRTNDASAPTISVPLSGEGSYDTKVTDGFTQPDGQTVDILFVIDDSGSMCEHQDTLINSYGNFIQHAAVWKNDYHLGVITVNVDDPKVTGRLNKGLQKPTFVTPGLADAQSLFQKYADVGCDGGSDAREAGLEAAVNALSAPLASDTGVACASDDTCRNDPAVCPDPATCQMRCVDGVCGGWNRGFLRADARLELIVLSDEEDQSSASLPFYIDFFKGLKGAMNAGMTHINAIVWDEAKCQGQSSQATGARYIEAANQTGGLVAPICSADYTTVMDQIGAQAFTAKRQFFLARPADPPTIKVQVNGTACTGTWTFDQSSNSLVFDGKDAANPCSQPKAGDAIQVKYDAVCFGS